MLAKKELYRLSYISSQERLQKEVKAVNVSF
jgi:hypothetical protein